MQCVCTGVSNFQTFKLVFCMYNELPLLVARGHVRYINVLAWLRGFRVKIANFSSFFCPSILKRDLDSKKTTPNIEV